MLAALLLASCTTTRWSIKDRAAIDTADYTVLSSNRILKQVGNVSPDHPVFELQLLDRNEYRYAEKVLAERNIQKYRPRWGFMTLGLLGAGLSFYAANTTRLVEGQSRTQSVALNATGAILTGISFLNMKPVGDPRPTGEERYLRKTGTRIKVDTVQVQSPETEYATISVSYRDSVLIPEQRQPFEQGKLGLNLAGEIDPSIFPGQAPDSLWVRVKYKDTSRNYGIPVSSVFLPYVRVEQAVTELRNEPEVNESNVLTDLAQGSQLQLVERIDGTWYKVLYGLSPTYISQTDGAVVWKSSDFQQEQSIVTIPNIPFGNIDVESNIPILSDPREGAAALIVTNQEYDRAIERRKYANRDGRLIRTYLTDALGYPEKQVRELRDIRSVTKVSDELRELGRTAGRDSSEVFVFISGHGLVRTEGEGTRFYLRPVGQSPSAATDSLVDLNAFMKRLSETGAHRITVLLDMDFSRADTAGNGESGMASLFNTLGSILEKPGRQMALFVSNRLNQDSGVFSDGMDTDKRHRIFPYFFAKALQERHTVTGEIVRYLNRNVTYTSRRLHDRPQDPLYIGSYGIDLSNR